MNQKNQDWLSGQAFSIPMSISLVLPKHERCVTLNLAPAGAKAARSASAVERQKPG